MIYRFFFEEGVGTWPDGGCVGCSMMADQVAHLAHLHARDTTLAYVSRAPQADITRLKARMGWEMPWYTITDGFDADHGVDEWHGTNAFFREGDQVFRTYFVNNRGDEALGSTWSYLDLTALGRQEEWEDSPEGDAAVRGLRVVAAPRRVRDGGRGVIVGAHVAGVPVEELLPTAAAPAARWSLARAWLWYSRRCGADETENLALRIERDLPSARAGGVRRVDQRGGAPALVPRRARVGHAGGLRRPARRGALRVVMRNPDTGAEYGGGGRYTEIDPPRRLAFTWLWDDQGTRTLIELDFEEADGAPPSASATAASGARRPCATTRAAGAGASTTWRRRSRRADGEHPEVTAIPLT